MKHLIHSHLCSVKGISCEQGMPIVAQHAPALEINARHEWLRRFHQGRPIVILLACRCCRAAIYTRICEGRSFNHTARLRRHEDLVQIECANDGIS
jgi:hypothetical protein